MATKNDITGDPLVSKSPNDAFREGWERIFGKKKKPRVEEEPVRESSTLTPEQKEAIRGLCDHIKKEK